MKVKKILGWLFSLRAPLRVRLARLAVFLLMGPVLLGFFPRGRQLTLGETEWFRSAFKESVDYSRVRIVHSPVHDLALWILNQDANTIGSRIFVSGNINSADFSKENDAGKKMGIMHEIGHGWQFQNCGGVTLLQGIKNGFNHVVLRKERESIYEADLGTDKDLLAHNIEQQASLLAEYYTFPSSNKVPKVLEQFSQNPSYISQNCSKLK